MKKVRKNLARKILCGLLAAGVLGVSGSALANSIGAVKVDGSDVSVTPSGEFSIGKDDSSVSISNSGTALAISSNTDVANIKGKNIDIKSENGAGAIVGSNGPHLYLGNANTEKISIDSGDDGIRVIKGYAEIKAKEISFNVRTAGCAAIWAQNNTEDDIAPANATSVKLQSDKIDITAVQYGLVAYSNSKLDVDGDVTINAPIALDVRGVSTVNINEDGTHKTVLNGDISFETPNSPGDAQNSGKKINANVNLNLIGKDSSWNGRAYQEYKINGEYKQLVDLTGEPYHGNVTGFKVNISDGAAWNMTGDSFINNVTVANGGAINVEEAASLANLQNVNMDEGTISLKGNGQKVNIIDSFNGTGTVATNSLSNNVNVSETAAAGDANITVQGTGDIADAIQRDASNAQKLADVVSSGEGEAKKSVASEVKTAEGKVGGAYYAKVDENGNINKASEVHAENNTNRAITDMASISIMTWRAENNDMNKRLGELRDSKGEHGAWARMARGESKYGAQNVKNQYNYYQVGYDEKLSVDPNWTVGVALTRTEGNSTFTNGSGENKHTGFAVYGSYLADNGSFIDLIAKYARMDNDYKTVTGAGSGDYETNGYSLSAEYGKRFTKDNGFWIEPQVELTYGKISSADYLTANKVQVSQGDTNSIVGRLGFSLGKDIKQGNVYVRASYLYDFDGETDVKMVDTVSGTPASYKQDLGGGWWEVGVGTNINLSDATHLYFDVEKTYGGNVATPWQWNAGVRWSF